MPARVPSAAPGPEINTRRGIEVDLFVGIIIVIVTLHRYGWPATVVRSFFITARQRHQRGGADEWQQHILVFFQTLHDVPFLIVVLTPWENPGLFLNWPASMRQPNEWAANSQSDESRFGLLIKFLGG